MTEDLISGQLEIPPEIWRKPDLEMVNGLVAHRAEQLTNSLMREIKRRRRPEYQDIVKQIADTMQFSEPTAWDRDCFCLPDDVVAGFRCIGISFDNDMRIHTFGVA